MSRPSRRYSNSSFGFQNQGHEHVNMYDSFSSSISSLPFDRSRGYGNDHDYYEHSSEPVQEDYAIQSYRDYDDCSVGSRCSRNSYSRPIRRGYHHHSGHSYESMRRPSMRNDDRYNRDSRRFEERRGSRRHLLPPRPSRQQPREETPMIEIAPGVYERLRRADETIKAIQMDFFIPCECLSCQETIFCIQDASYVLCPKCRVVSRNEEIDELHCGGVGLGFTFEQLASTQAQCHANGPDVGIVNQGCGMEELQDEVGYEDDCDIERSVCSGRSRRSFGSLQREASGFFLCIDS